ncbi:hypothetical protein GPEL0_01r2748 [Geoanaerobacter pelophilus]|uniref:DUF3793 family protein n=1 Tax=Geoanaerobacter pelophilus TaxID=60036 RepID=A0ABQ0MJ33_9BACT|nr:DUF3793 family protein [Geoanaerobacter pelophilus]GAW67095.1 hypothetical protein GPEL0_01r2748 [Geoanaerobacter pelophilus]
MAAIGNRENHPLDRIEAAVPAVAARGARPGWQDFSRLYTEDRDCLASFLALELAEVLRGAKPANLVCLANKRRSCGRNLYLLWKEHGSALIEASGLKVRVLADRGTSVLLLLYSRDALGSLLAQKSVRVILRKAGYAEPDRFEAVLSELEQRVEGEGFPHEIGVFLGYPLKDVVGFMGWAPISFTCQGPWKIFGNPAPSLELAENHRKCRCEMSLQLASGCNPLDCLKKNNGCGESTQAQQYFLSAA